jgi:phosphatidylglycerol:prolipoprotein diacylglycerol transferase
LKEILGIPMIPYETHKVVVEHTFNLGFRDVHWIFPTYTMMMFIGIASALYVAEKKYRKEKIPLIPRINTFIVSAIATMVGGRLFYLLFYTDEPLYMVPFRMFTIWEVGMVSIGGFLFGIAALYLMLRFYKIDFLKVLDIIAAPIGLGMFFARLGCFLAGCCYGRATDVSWAIIKNNIMVHPTQIYSSFYNLLIFIIITWFSYSRPDKGHKKQKVGQQFALLLILYGTFRFLVEFIRINPIVAIGLSLQQLMCLVLIVVGLVLFKKAPYR